MAASAESSSTLRPAETKCVECFAKFTVPFLKNGRLYLSTDAASPHAGIGIRCSLFWKLEVSNKLACLANFLGQKFVELSGRHLGSFNPFAVEAHRQFLVAHCTL